MTRPDTDAEPRRLVLWDIDGTLVNTAPFGRDAFARAFETVLGRRPERLVPMAGRTDLEIALEVLEVNGVEDGERHLDALGRALESALTEVERDIAEQGRALPGAAAALDALRREHVVQSLLTGNIEPNALIKLRAFELDGFVDLEVGGYGSDHRVRWELVAIARAKAERKYGTSFAAEDTVLVGDTPLDVAAGLEGGARVVGVATGSYDEPTLLEAGAHAVLADLRDPAAVVHAVLAR